ncbi:MAG: SulP family inorganic anion transporter, partial [Rhizobiaceae bacterium]|nr:SulP family inorganic anion transporter [Rhizobiaceae bacterium]
LTVFRDLTEAIVVGFALGSVLFIHRMSKTTAIETHIPFVADDRADDANGARQPYDEAVANDPEVVVYRISGAFFFGAAASIGSVLDRIADTHRLLIIELSGVPFLDSTAANTIESLAHKARRRGVAVHIAGANADVRGALHAHQIDPPLVHYAATVEAAMRRGRTVIEAAG